MTTLPEKDLEVDKDGGFLVPDRIALLLYRALLLEILAEREGAGRIYWIDSHRMRVFEKNEKK